MDLFRKNKPKTDEPLDVVTRKLTQEMAALTTAASTHLSHGNQVLKQKFQLSDFNFQRTLGTGSFGRVHLVQRRSDNKYMAIKVMKKTEVVRLKQVEHTLNEQAVLERIECPFTVNLLGSFKDSQNLYFVLEYVAGGELFSLLRRSQRFANNVARFYASEVVLAFEYMHARGIVYRDLKPENLLITVEGHLKITDFGFAKYITTGGTYTLCGTPDYLAPEIIQSKGYGFAVDWWALGVLIYEMLAGYPPFFDDDHVKLYEKILQCRYRFPSHMDANAKDLVKNLLMSDLSMRYGNLKNGVKDIKQHPWFSEVDWEKTWRMEVQPPYKPPLKHAGDTSNFDVYDENKEPYGKEGPDPYADKFSTF